MDKLEAMMEADRRGILPPDQKALLDEARSRGLAAKQTEKPLIASVGEFLMEAPRQIGLTARHAIEGAGDTAGVFTEPIRAAINPALRAFGAPAAASTGDMARALADKIGLPSPQNATERVAGDVSRMMAGAGGLVGAARGVSSFATNPLVTKTAEALAASPGVQMGAAAGAGAAGGSVREAGGSPGAQFGASLAGGLTGAGATSAGISAYNGIANAVSRLIAPKANPQNIEITLNQILSDNGVNLSQVPAAVRADLMTEVKNAMNTGRDLRPDVLRRIADYAVVGATPTRGSVTLDPVQITQERNLAKLGANSTDPNLQGLARLQNENTGTLIRNLNDMGAGRTDSMKAGEAAVGAINSRDATAKAIEKALYARAKDSSGRALELDREGFVLDAYNQLGKENKGAFLPAEIKTLIEEIRTGQTVLPDGTKRPLPFNVDVIDNLKTTLADASRSSKNGNETAAIKLVRGALEDAQPRNPGEAGAEAMQAYDKARRFARALRTWRESAEGIQSALNETPPDRFVKDFILSSGNKAATGEVEKMLATIRKSPEAMQQVKQNVVDYFKSQAMNGAADELRTFSQSGYNKALRDFGDAKLKLFFTPEEITQLKAIGRVASYEQVQPRGSAVNNSNTGAALGGLLDRIASSKILGRIPFGDAAIRQPAGNWSAQIGVNNAMDATGAASAKAPVSAQRARLEALIGPALLLSSPSANAGKNDKRR